MSDKPQFSVCLSNFLNLITEAQRDYQWNYDEVNRDENRTKEEQRLEERVVNRVHQSSAQGKRHNGSVARCVGQSSNTQTDEDHAYVLNT